MAMLPRSLHCASVSRGLMAKGRTGAAISTTFVMGMGMGMGMGVIGKEGT